MKPVKYNFIIVSLFILLFAIAAPAAMTHRYSFDADTTDSVGSADGTLIGDAVVSGGALVLDGTDDWMEMDGSVIALDTYTEATIEMWYTPANGGNPSYTMLAYFGDTAGTLGADYLFLSSARGDDVSRTGISVGETETPWSDESGVNGTEYDDGNPHHIAAVITATDISLYQDGEYIDTAALDGDNTIDGISEVYAYLGKGGYTNDDEWEGAIDEVRIYDSALSTQDIADHYAWGPNFLTAPLVEITESDGGTVLYTEQTGVTDYYMIDLRQQPTLNVTVTVDPPAGLSVGAGNGQPLDLIFTSQNWSQTRIVTVSIADVQSLNGTECVTHTVTSGDPAYSGMTAPDVCVEVRANACGQWGYLENDTNFDCIVDLEDFATLAKVWLMTEAPLDFGGFAEDWLLSTLEYDPGLAARSVQETDEPFAVDPSTVLNTIDEKVYGHFLEHIYHSANGGLWGELVWNRSFEMIGDGGALWSVDGSDLVQSSLATDVHMEFGDTAWTDYELTLEAYKESGSEGFLVIFRAPDNDNFYWLNLGGWNNTAAAVEKEVNGSRSTVSSSVSGSVPTGEWVDIRVRCEGDTFTVWMNEPNNPDPLLEFTDSDSPYLSGGIGLGSWSTAVRFRNIEVTEIPGSTILYSGLPALPPASFAADFWDVFGTGTANVDDTDALNDDYSVQYVSDGSVTGLIQDDFSFAQQAYTGSVWMKGSMPAGVRVELLDGATVIGQAMLGTPTSTWTEYPFQITSTGSTNDGSLRITMLGAGTARVDQVSLMGQDALDTGGYRPDLLEAVDELNPPIIRWPGGCYASAYFWKDGIGPQHEHHKFPINLWDDQDTNSYGTDEFLRMCEAIGTEPLICINSGLLNGTCGVSIPYKLTEAEYLQDALDWMEYCNGNAATTTWGAVRAANGHPAPYNVTYWEIDNEVWSTSYGGGITNYIPIVETFASAMQDKADELGVPIQLIACGGGSYNMSWNQSLIDACATMVDYISVHHYEGENGYKTGPETYDSFLTTLSDYIAGSANPDLKIYNSEWNLQTIDWRTGLYAGGILNVYEKHGADFRIGGPALFLRHISADDWDNAFINFDHTGWFPAPNYVVMKLWRDRYEPYRVETTGLDTDLNVTTAMSADGQTLQIRIVNPDDVDKSLQFDLDASFVPETAYMHFVAPGSLYARNTLAEPDAVSPEAKVVGMNGQTLRLLMPAYSAGVITVEAAQP